MRQNDYYLKCAIHLYASEQDAKKGADSGGSGCIVSINSETDPYGLPPHIYAVTNKHVIKDGGLVIRYNIMPFSSDPLTRSKPLSTEGRDWASVEGDDLAVTPISLPPWAQYFPVNLDNFAVTEEKIEQYNIGIGDDVFMVSRVAGHDGKDRNKPALRFGNISKMADAEDKIDIDGKLQEAYLVEMRSLSGNSGSPVFFYVPMHNVPDGNMKERRGWAIGPLLLGIHTAQFREEFPVMLKGNREHPDGLYVRPSGGMAAVIPVWRLRKLLNRRDLKMARQSEDEQRAEQKAERRGRFERDS